MMPSSTAFGTVKAANFILKIVIDPHITFPSFRLLTLPLTSLPTRRLHSQPTRTPKRTSNQQNCPSYFPLQTRHPSKNHIRHPQSQRDSPPKKPFDLLAHDNQSALLRRQPLIGIAVPLRQLAQRTIFREVAHVQGEVLAAAVGLCRGVLEAGLQVGGEDRGERRGHCILDLGFLIWASEDYLGRSTIYWSDSWLLFVSLSGMDDEVREVGRRLLGEVEEGGLDEVCTGSFQ